MSEKKLLFKRFLDELRGTNDSLNAIARRLGISEERLDQLLATKRFWRGLEGLCDRSALHRDVNFAKTGIISSENMLRGVVEASQEEKISAAGRVISVAGARLSQVGRKQGPKGGENGSLRNAIKKEQNALGYGDAVLQHITPEHVAAFDRLNGELAGGVEVTPAEEKAAVAV